MSDLRFFSGDYVGKVFHVILPEQYAQLLDLSTAHAILRLSLQRNCFLEAEDPITETLLQRWDIKRLQSFAVEFLPAPCLRFVLSLAANPPVRQESILEIPSVPAAYDILIFVETLVKLRLPWTYSSLGRRERFSTPGNTLVAVHFDAVRHQPWLAISAPSFTELPARPTISLPPRDVIRPGVSVSRLANCYSLEHSSPHNGKVMK